MPDYHGQHKSNDWNLWNLPQFLSVPAYDVGTLGIPIAKKCDYVPEKLIPFNYVKTAKQEDYSACVHFFINDYQFERCWNKPDVYIPMLAKFSAIIAPDFSVYNDMPTAMQMWQLYKSRMFAYMCYQAGIKVIPNLIFSDTMSFGRWGFAFDGIENGSTVCLSNSGSRRNPDARKALKTGLKGFLQKCRPKTLIVYGDELEPMQELDGIDIIVFKPFGFGKDYISQKRNKEV